MKRLINILVRTKQWILSIVMVSFTRQSFDFSLFPYTIKGHNNTKRHSQVFNLRISFLKNLRYISLSITHWFFIELRFYN